MDLRKWFLWFWLTGMGLIVLYLLLRSSPSASGLPLIPSWSVAWLNHYHDLRTLPLAFGYAIIPALLLYEVHWRRLSLLVVAVILILGETAQLMIASRSFTWADIFFSLMGVGAAEGIAVLVNGRKLKTDGLKNGISASG